jgi:post-segregation antitoxin (ccd killing protein)
MTEVTVSLPDSLAQEARAAGLLTPQAVEAMLRETLRKQRTEQARTGLDLLFGMWRDREDMADVEGYIRKLRAPRYRHDGARNEDQDQKDQD